MKTIFEKSEPGERAFSIPFQNSAWSHFKPPEKWVKKTPLSLPEVSELNLMRHFSALSHRNRGIDNIFYPLGSCTMKYNPRVNEWAASLQGFTKTHPLAPPDTVQGNLHLIDELIKKLCAICGMAGGTLSPHAGAQGEFVGIQMIAAYHQARNDHERREMLIPDNAHGTNPASAHMGGFRIVSIPTGPDGDLDIDALKKALSPKTAGLMLTNPNTLGLFSSRILEISSLVHEAGGLLYYDGANLNPILEVARPGDMGFDVMHLNLHKTFSTPHGGGGPGAGPVLCRLHLMPFLPTPRVSKQGKAYVVQWEDSLSIGSIATFFGNFSIYLRAYLYILLHGTFGLRRIAEVAVLNANYLKKRLSSFLKIPFSDPCMHEFVVQMDHIPGIRALDVAKRLLDYGIYAPTIYFPLIIKECMLIEPTESESKATLDAFIDILKKIMNEYESDPTILRKAPHELPVGRLDEARAAKFPILKISP